MSAPRSSRLGVFAMPGSWSLGLPILVVLVLAGLQLRAALSVRDSDIAHLRQVVHERAEGVAWDFDHELARARDWFRVEAPVAGDAWPAFAARHAVWQARAPQPRLFRAWYLVDDDGAAITARRFDPARGALVDAAWSDELAPVRAVLQTTRGALDVGPELAAPAGLLIALPGDGRRYALGLLDVDFVTSTLVPQYARDNLGEDDGLAYEIELRRASDGAVLLAPPRPHPTPDMDVSIFHIESAHLDEPLVTPGEDTLCHGLWRLRVTHRDGSIAASVAHRRRRDAVVTGVVVALLVASLVLLVLAARRAQRMAAQQVTFVAGITHELRTPLAVIRSAAENLADGLVVEPGHVRRYGQVLLAEGHRLSRMVEHAIDLASLEPGRRAAPDEAYDVAALVAEVTAGQRDVTATIAAPLPAVRGDQTATRMVLGNLVENARKHAPGAPIAIDVVDAAPGVRIEVCDRGPGIDAEDVPHVFEPFYRGRRARDGQVPGSGLGLSVVKRLVELQRGTIDVRSQPGEGVRFIVHLPRGA